MDNQAPSAGVCVVRAEVQGGHVLISVTTTGASEGDLPPAEIPRHFVDVDEALQAVRLFLTGFRA